MSEKELLELEDFACFAEVASEANRDLGRARIYAQCLAEQIEPLCSEAALSERLRAAYTGIRDDLMKLAKLAKELERKYRHLSVWEEFHADVDYRYSSDALVANAKRAIAWINSVEQRLSATMDGLLETLRDSHHPLCGWEDAMVGFKVMLVLESSPERHCYQDLLEPIYFRTSTDFSQYLNESAENRLLGDGDNWNDRRDTDHPLHDVRMGYLAHAVFDQTTLPWQLLGRVREIEVDVEVQASRTYTITSEPDLDAT